MKTVILAGGLGSRLSEITELKPKPMVHVGGRPILWHIMKMYGSHGINEFVVCCGYKGYVIKEYFANYVLHNTDITVNLAENTVKMRKPVADPWTVHCIDTGVRSGILSRIQQIEPLITEDHFCLTYGDGVSDVDIKAVIAFHKTHDSAISVTAALPPGRFGRLTHEGNLIQSFDEKPAGEGGYINGGFFVMDRSVFENMKTSESWEKFLEEMAAQGQLRAHFHDGFWACMDTLRDKRMLDDLWENNPPWKSWS